MVFVCLGICYGVCHAICLEICLVGKNIKKNHGLPEFALGPPFGSGSDANSGRPCTLFHNLPCRTPCRLFIHELFFEPLGLHLLVRSELGRSPPFRPMRALALPWSGAFSLVCEVTLRFRPNTKEMDLETFCYTHWGPPNG